MPVEIIEHTPDNKVAISIPVKPPPKRHPVILSVKNGQNWTGDISEDELARFIERAEPEDINWVEVDGTTYLLFEIEEEDAEYRTVYKSAATCAFDSSEQLLKNMFGVNLHSSDRDWYKNHPDVVSAGVPDAATFGVLQALVKPYGFGISEIMYLRGRGKTGDTHLWAEALGVNPMSQNNSLATDDDYLAMFAELDAESFAEIEAEVRSNGFRYVDEVQGPAIIFGAMGNGGGGHASYLAPRQKSRAFQYAVRYKRLQDINYQTDVSALINDHNESVEPRKELNFWTTKFKGKTMNQWTSSNNHLFSGYQGGYQGGYRGGYQGRHEGYSGVPDQKKAKAPSYTPPKQKEKVTRLEDEEAIPLEEAEKLMSGFVELGARSGVKFAYKEDFEFNPYMVGEIADFAKSTAKELSGHIQTNWKLMPCETQNLCNKGRSAKRMRRMIRMFTNEVAKYKEGLCNFILALDRATSDCERWIIFTLCREVYL